MLGSDDKKGFDNLFLALNLNIEVEILKVLMINGSPHKEGCTYTALKEIEKELTSWKSKRKLCISERSRFVGVQAATNAVTEDAFSMMI